MASNFQKGFGAAVFAAIVAALATGITLRSHDGESDSSIRGSLDSAAAPSSMVASLVPGNSSNGPTGAPSVRAKEGDSARGPASKPLATLNEILASHGDNDPRLDTELLHLDTLTKKLFRERYASIAREEQNDRGTIVFLLGRNIIDNDDVQFIASVLKENPCLSLENCDTPPARTNSHEAPSDMALAYSQAMSLVSFEKFLDANPASEMKPSILENLREASKSSSAPISRLAGKALAKFENTTAK